MEPTDITIEILTSIRDELRGLNGRVDGLNDRVDGLNDRVDQLHRRQVETELRLSTELVAIHQVMNQTVELLREQAELRPVVSDHEKRIKQLEEKLEVS